ncbi:MAG TPA: PQQ-binding-like beta-propeller repeat protein, partial [Planctomycetaceae bacterium]|nr:PQQ-binding-like beta-propeller repeat protein [Planctomycetaceae bacterium]
MPLSLLRIASLILLLGASLHAAEPYEFSLALKTLEQDLTSQDYQAVLATMIPTDLRAEWQRVATADNYHLFAKQHGGVEAVLANPDLKAAYTRRKDVADKFLQLMTEAYAAKKQKPPFVNPELLLKALESADRRGTAGNQPTLAIEPILPAPGADEQWAALRGPTQQGHVLHSALPKTWDTLWKVSLPGRGNSAPVVWGDRIFVTSEGPRAESAKESPERFLLAFDRRDGRLLWKYTAPQPKEVETLYWKNTFASSTVATDGERVIAFLGNSGLVCCDIDGKPLWQTDLGLFPTMHGPGTTPVLYGDLVIVVQDQTKGTSLFAAYDKRTGEKRWQHERKNQPGWSSPVLLRVGSRDELIYNGVHVVHGYDPATGEELWRVNGSSEEAIPMIVSGGGLLYSSSGRNGPIFAIRPGGN